jgi:hypothetical protein
MSKGNVKRKYPTPNEHDFCKCGGMFSRKHGTCLICGRRKSLGNLFEPGRHDWGTQEIAEVLAEEAEEA